MQRNIIGRAILGVLAVVIFATGTAVAAGPSASFTFTTDPNVGISGAPGSGVVPPGGTASVADLAGLDCDVWLDVHNNDSVRSGTNILITAGIGYVEADDVEAVKGDAPPRHVGHLVMGTTAYAIVQFGPAGVASVDATIRFECPDEPPVTTTPETPTTTRPTVPTTSTPVGIPTGGAPPAAVIATPAFTG